MITLLDIQGDPIYVRPNHVTSIRKYLPGVDPLGTKSVVYVDGQMYCTKETMDEIRNKL